VTAAFPRRLVSRLFRTALGQRGHAPPLAQAFVNCSGDGLSDLQRARAPLRSLEGFYLRIDEIEFQVTWEEDFDRIVRELRRMAIRETQEWAGFEMDAENAAHCEACKRGDIPHGVRVEGLGLKGPWE
jgi:hypothetical protein